MVRVGLAPGPTPPRVASGWTSECRLPLAVILTCPETLSRIRGTSRESHPREFLAPPAACAETEQQKAFEGHDASRRRARRTARHGGRNAARADRAGSTPRTSWRGGDDAAGEGAERCRVSAQRVADVPVAAGVWRCRGAARPRRPEKHNPMTEHSALGAVMLSLASLRCGRTGHQMSERKWGAPGAGSYYPCKGPWNDVTRRRFSPII